MGTVSRLGRRTRAPERVPCRLAPAISAFAACSVVGSTPLTAYADDPIQLEAVDVTTTAEAQADDTTESSLGADTNEVKRPANGRKATGDSAELLRDTPGVSLYGAGGISSLPVIHGLADDRLRIQVDGVELMPACPNHMNAPLSYVAPTMVQRVTLFAGLTPVSVGGDSLGGTIQVESPAPRFAGPDTPYLASGELGGFYRSNGHGIGYHLRATGALRWINLSYHDTSSWSDNYSAGGSFKEATAGLRANEVGSSAYRNAAHRGISVAVRHDEHLLQLDLGRQSVDFEGFPNQRMDMTSNDNVTFATRYSLRASWGDLKARFAYQHTNHAMDMGEDRFSYGTGMPMLTEQRTWSASVQGNLLLSERHTLRTGLDFQRHVLHDWWPPVGGSMGPNTFWNLDYGRRQRVGGFVELETQWTEQWTSLVGVRHDFVTTDAAAVQGYDNGLGGLWGADAAAFNAASHDRANGNWDITAMLRHVFGPGIEADVGYARKSRSPNLYQRYPWATNAMAALMNNFVGDGNGYLGRIDLQPEVAHTLSASTRLHAPDNDAWEVKARAYYTYVHHYIDAVRCNFGQCPTVQTGFVLLQYANQSAELFGGEMSGQRRLFKSDRLGDFGLRGMLNYVQGTNRSTSDGLYAIMPLNGKASILHQLGGWHGAVELVAVAEKSRVSQVRNEVPTKAYGIVTLRGGYEWNWVRTEIAIENLFDQFYSDPLGGAYLGQGPSMTTRGIPWGTPVPGRGRSLNLTLTLNF